MTTPIFSREVITLPVSEIERALRFYVDQAGFTLDVDYAPHHFRVVQVTPPGSRCAPPARKPGKTTIAVERIVKGGDAVVRSRRTISSVTSNILKRRG